MRFADTVYLIKVLQPTAHYFRPGGLRVWFVLLCLRCYYIISKETFASDSRR